MGSRRGLVVGVACVLLAGCQTYGPLSDSCTYDKHDLVLAHHAESLAAGGHAPNILVLSGGGRNGAYGAGFLRGLATRGDVDLKFDIVTGVSTGALQGTFVFLGRRDGPRSDYERLSDLYTHVNNRDIYRMRLLPFRKSLYKTRPLAHLIEKKITDEDIEAVGRVENRRFYVGTVDLAEGVMKVHDMGCIARKHSPDYYRKILLASASIPAVFPSTQIKDSLQVDGGVRDQALLEPFMLAPNSNPSLTLLINMPLAVEQRPARKGLIYTAVRGAHIMMDEGLENDVARILAFAPAHTHLKHIPLNAMDDYDPIDFDTRIMRMLEALGYEEATRTPIPWD